MRVNVVPLGTVLEDPERLVPPMTLILCGECQLSPADGFNGSLEPQSELSVSLGTERAPIEGRHIPIGSECVTIRGGHVALPKSCAPIPSECTPVLKDCAPIPGEYVPILGECATLPNDCIALPNDCAELLKDSAMLPKDCAELPKDYAPARKDGAGSRRLSIHDPLAKEGCPLAVQTNGLHQTDCDEVG